MLTKTIKREIFASLPAIDGRMEDMSQEERDTLVKKLFENTQRVIEYGIDIPIKEGHDDKNERRRGQLVKVDKQYKATPTPHWVIIGEIQLDDEMYQLYQDDQLPAASVEIADSANLMSKTGQETKIDEYIFAVALCGITPVAMPQLERISNYDNQPYMIFSQAVGPQVYGKSNQEKKMDFAKFKESFMSKFAEILEELMPSNDEGEKAKDKENMPPKKEKEKDKDDKYETDPETDDEFEQETEAQEMTAMDDKDKTIAALQATVDELQTAAIDSAYQAAAMQGRVTAEKKNHFVQVAKTQGLKFAQEVFSAKIVEVPQGETLQGAESIDKDTVTKEDKRLTDLYTAQFKQSHPNKSDEDIQKMVVQTIDRLKSRKK